MAGNHREWCFSASLVRRRRQIATDRERPYQFGSRDGMIAPLALETTYNHVLS